MKGSGGGVYKTEGGVKKEGVLQDDVCYIQVHMHHPAAQNTL